MPRSCSICSHPGTAEISKALASGVSVREAAFRFDVTPASLQRHRSNCLRARPKAAKLAGDTARVNTDDVFRFAIGERCPACGLTDSVDPPGLLRRAERLLFLAESIAIRAERSNDARLALAAADRGRQSLELLMRGNGMLRPDDGNDRPHVNIFAGLPLAELQRIRSEVFGIREALPTDRGESAS